MGYDLPSLTDLRLSEHDAGAFDDGDTGKIGPQEEYFVVWEGATGLMYLNYDGCLEYIINGKDEEQNPIYGPILYGGTDGATLGRLKTEYRLSKKWRKRCQRPSKRAGRVEQAPRPQHFEQAAGAEPETPIQSYKHIHTTFLKRQKIWYRQKIDYSLVDRMVEEEDLGGVTDAEDGRQEDDQPREHRPLRISPSKPQNFEGPFKLTNDHVVAKIRLRATQRLLQFQDVACDPNNIIPVCDNFEKGARERLHSLAASAQPMANYYFDVHSSRDLFILFYKATFYMYTTYPLISQSCGVFYDNFGAEVRYAKAQCKIIVFYAKMKVPETLRGLYNSIYDVYGRCNPLLDASLNADQMNNLVDKYEPLFIMRFLGIDLTSNCLLRYAKSRQLDLK
jgi:hypothetical protein